MELTVALRMAFRALGRNKMRTALTMLGVIIGVAAVICTVAIGEGASERIQSAISNMGANMVWIEAGRREPERRAHRQWRDEVADPR